jgi:serine kinase of HPr protein (carbohydrate metabolism regulator)
MINFYDKIDNKELKIPNPGYNKKHIFKLPLLGMIIGQSGSGKTNILLNIIYRMNLTFDKLIIVNKTEEPLYNFLKDKLGDKLEIINIEKFDIDNYKDDDIKFLVFDDMLLLNKKENKIIEESYIRGRKNGFMAIIYLSQNFYNVSLNIRRNLNYLIIKQISKDNLDKIIKNYFSDVNKEKIYDIYDRYIISYNNTDFLMLDLNNKKIYKNFDLTPIKY